MNKPLSMGSFSQQRVIGNFGFVLAYFLALSSPSLVENGK
jgi:hypothetical protein